MDSNPNRQRKVRLTWRLAEWKKSIPHLLILSITSLYLSFVI
jgi:hypothetical protein